MAVVQGGSMVDVWEFVECTCTDEDVIKICWSFIFRSLKCSVFLLFFVFETEFRSCYPGWSAMARSQLTSISTSWVQAILLPQPPEQLGLQANFCIFSRDRGFAMLVGWSRTTDLR